MKTLKHEQLCFRKHLILEKNLFMLTNDSIQNQYGKSEKKHKP